jgi:hypothetical protein
MIGDDSSREAGLQAKAGHPFSTEMILPSASLSTLIEKTPDADLVREMIGLAAEG